MPNEAQKCHGHSLDMILKNERSVQCGRFWRLHGVVHGVPAQCLKIKYDIFDYGEFNCELYLLIK